MLVIIKINKKIANEIQKNFAEVILAKDLKRKLFKILSKKKNLRLIDISKYTQKNNIVAKMFDGSFLLQDKDIKQSLRKKFKIRNKKKAYKKRTVAS